MSDDGKVVFLKTLTTLPLPPDQILEQARGDLTEVVVVGWDQTGDLDVRSSTSDLREVLWLLERAKQFILKLGDEE